MSKSWPRKRDFESFVEDAYGTTDFEVIASVPILWSGWEGDTAAAVVHLADGRRVWAVADGIDVSADRVRETLRARLTVYRKVAADTESLLALTGETS